MRTRRGQALIELAVGMVALMLVTCLLLLFTQYIAKSLEIENGIRSDTAVYAAKVEVDRFLFESVLGIHNLHIDEPHGPTDREIGY